MRQGTVDVIVPDTAWCAAGGKGKKGENGRGGSGAGLGREFRAGPKFGGATVDFLFARGTCLSALFRLSVADGLP